MYRKILFILIFLFLLKFQVLVGQSTYKIENLKFSDGLPSDIVFFSTKKEGKLYIATQRGLCLYDGYRFVKNTQLSNMTNHLFTSKNKLYFYSSGKGLCYLNSIFQEPQIVAKVNYNDSIPNNDHYDNVYVDRKNRVWCSDQNSVKYFSNSKKYSFVIAKNSNPSFTVTFLETRTKEFFIATDDGLFVWDEKSNSIQLHPNTELANSKIISATVTGNFIYFTTLDGKLLIYDSISKTLSTEVISRNLTSQFKLVDNTNSVFFYDKNTLYQYDISKHTKEIIQSTSGEINHIFYDDVLHLFWISTTRGLVKLSKINDDIVSLNIPNSKTIVSIVQDNEATIWCVSKNNKIYSYSKNNHWNAYQSPNIKTEFEHLFLKNNQLYATANDGLYSLTNGVLKLLISTKIPFKKAVIDENNLLWIIPSKGAIRVYDAVSFKEKKEYILNTSSFWSDNTFNDIAVAPNGRIWLASWMPKDYGISYFDNKTHLFVQINSLIQFKNNPKFVTDYYNRIAFINNNNIIFSGYGGWNIVSPEGEILHSLNTDLYKVANDHIEGISQDSKGNIWFACAEGLNQYNFKTNKVVNVSSIDGLATNDITYGYFASKNNKLMIGTDKGLQIIDLNNITKTKLINKLELTAIIKDGTYLFSKKNEYHLDYKFTELTILFSSLSFSEKEKIIYRYQFKGEQKWNYLGTIPKLSLIKLSPGNYDILIQAGDNLGNWQKKSLNITLKITPPFYNSLWFFILLFLLLASIGFFANRYLVKQEKIKGRLKRKIKDVEMQTLRSQMNPHFLFNSLNSINSFIIQQKSREASSYLTTFSKLMRNILENSRHETITLEKELETLKMYLELEAVRLEYKFDYEIVYDKNLEVESIKIPPLIIQPFAENAIWHGLHNKKEKGLLKIVVQNEKNSILNIKIIDDGIGRKASALLKKEQVTHKSYGINITINRLILLNPKNNFKIIDLVDDQDNATGTEVELQIYL